MPCFDECGYNFSEPRHLIAFIQTVDIRLYIAMYPHFQGKQSNALTCRWANIFFSFRKWIRLSIYMHSMIHIFKESNKMPWPEECG